MKFRIMTMSDSHKIFWIQQKVWGIFWRDIRVIDINGIPTRSFIPTKLLTFDSQQDAYLWLMNQPQAVKPVVVEEVIIDL